MSLPSILATPPTDGNLVETERLQCRRANPTDLKGMKLLFQAPEMTHFLGGPASDEKIDEWLDSWQIQWDKGTSFCGLVVRRDSQELVGSASIHPSCIPDEKGAEISYMILPEYQRRGFAGEISRALIACAFETMKIPRLVISTSRTTKYRTSSLVDLDFTYRESAVLHTLNGRTTTIMLSGYWSRVVGGNNFKL